MPPVRTPSASRLRRPGPRGTSAPAPTPPSRSTRPTRSPRRSPRLGGVGQGGIHQRRRSRREGGLLGRLSARGPVRVARDPSPTLFSEAAASGRDPAHHVVMISDVLRIAFPCTSSAHARPWPTWRGDATREAVRAALQPDRPLRPFRRPHDRRLDLPAGFLFGWAKPTPVNTANLEPQERRGAGRAGGAGVEPP